MSRLPTVGGDDNTWGNVLNDFLDQAHNSDGSLKGSAVSASGAEMAANKGQASGYAPLDNTGKVPSSNLPNTTTPDATNSSKGIVQLSGDLGGSAASPTVPGLASKVGSVSATDATITVGGTSTAPTIGVNAIPESKVTNLTTDLASKLDASVIDTDGTLAADSDTRVATQKAVKTYVDSSAASPSPVTADYVVETNGSNITATPRPGSGLTAYSGTDAYTVIQNAIIALTPTGGGVGSGGGKITIIKGYYYLTNELTISGWENASFNPLSQLVIEGEGYATTLVQTITGKNGLVIKNGANFVLRDLRIYTGANSKSSLLLDSNGTDEELSCMKSQINNVHLDSNSTAYPSGYFKNFMDLEVGTLHVQSSSNTALVLENDSTTTHYGNSHFGFLRCSASASSPYAGLMIQSTSATNFMNLLSFSNYECISGYYGIHATYMNFATFDFVDIEANTKPVYFDGSASGNETRNNSIKSGYILANSGVTAITCTLYTGGNEFSVAMSTSSTSVPISDASAFRPVNKYDLYVDNATAVGLINITNNATIYRIRRVDGSVLSSPSFDKTRGQTGAWAIPNDGYNFSGMSINGQVTSSQGTVWASRFVPTRNMTIVKIGFCMYLAATTNDQIDVGLYDATGARLVHAGATSSVVNGSTGVKTVAVSSTTLTAGTTYYAALWYGPTSGTPPSMVSITTGNNLVPQMFGAGAGALELTGMFESVTGGLPSTLPMTPGSNQIPALAVLES